MIYNYRNYDKISDFLLAQANRKHEAYSYMLKSIGTSHARTLRNSIKYEPMSLICDRIEHIASMDVYERIMFEYEIYYKLFNHAELFSTQELKSYMDFNNNILE